MVFQEKKICSEPKPQDAFKQVLADNSYSQFKHIKLQETDLQSDEENSNLHPYRAEISNLMENPNVGFLPFLDGFEKWCIQIGGGYVWVETEEQLRELVEVLNNEKVFAVDTEQHSERSFLGFTSLLQISTISKDYLVDSIILHDVMGLLRPVFANPEICKVFHGANNDVHWLQRDFHIYVVNLFDTEKACTVLSKPGRSLAYLLETYCNVAKNELLQRGDWTLRPLPEEMLRYASADTHYLLYITYCLCLELKQLEIDSKGKGAIEYSSPADEFHFLLKASRLSSVTCLRLFAKKVEACPGKSAASSILSGQEKILPSGCDAKFQELVRRLCLWRDVMARLHDESLVFVLSEKAIIALADEIPTTEADIRDTIRRADLDVESPSLVPLQSPSPVVDSHMEDLLWLLQNNIASLENIFQILIRRHLGPDESCPRTAYNCNLLSIGLTDGITFSHNGSSASVHVAKKQTSRELFAKKYSCKAPVYKEHKVYTRYGELLCHCDDELRDNLEIMDRATIVYEDEDEDGDGYGTGPCSVWLNFDLQGPTPDDYDIQTKKNKCVGCGEGEHYMQYNIIPPCYGRNFLQHMKSGLSHDTVLVCVDCKEKALAAADKYKKQVAAEFKIPLFVCNTVGLDEPRNTPASSLPVVSSEDVRDAAIALQRHGEKLPPKRREKLMQVLETYYGRSEITAEDIKKAQLVGMNPHGRRKFEKKRGFKHAKEDNISGSNENDKLSSQGQELHGKLVVKQLKETRGEDGIREFCQRWKLEFVKAVNPRFMPDHWVVNV